MFEQFTRSDGSPVWISKNFIVQPVVKADGRRLIEAPDNTYTFIMHDDVTLYLREEPKDVVDRLSKLEEG